MKHLISIAIILFISSNIAHGLSDPDSLWYAVKGEHLLDESWGVDTDSEGNVYWGTHQTRDGTTCNMFVYKLSPEGDEIWRTQWGEDKNVQTYVVTVKEPFVYVGGTIWNATADMAVVALRTSDGGLEWDFPWDQGYGYEEADGLVVDEDAIYVAGWTESPGENLDIAVLRLTLDGELVWNSVWGSDRWDEANGQIVIDSENVYVAGRYDALNFWVGGDAVLASFLKADGSYLRHKTWGGPQADMALGMTGDADFLYLVGCTLNYGRGTQIGLLKCDYDGNMVWGRIWGGDRDEWARAVEVTGDGHVFVAGKTQSFGAGAYDVVLLKYSPQGTRSWAKTWGMSKNDVSHGVALFGDHVYIAGETYNAGFGKNDAFLVKATQEGEFPGLK